MTESTASRGEEHSWLPREEALDIRYLWRVLAKRMWIVAASVACTFGAAAAYTFLATPIYTASTLLMTEEEPLDVVDIQDVLTRAVRSSDTRYDNTQIDILKSRTVAAQVIRTVDLAHEPLLRDPDEPWRDSGDVDPRLIARYLADWLEIVPSSESRMVTVRFSSPSAELSARVANAHAEAYVRYGLELRTQASRRAVELLQKTLDELRERTVNSVAALQAFRQKHGALEFDEKESLSAARLADLREKLSSVELQRIELESQILLMKEKGFGSLPAVLKSPIINSLKEQLSEFESQYAHASAELRPHAPQPSGLKAQVEDARQRLQKEIRDAAEGVRAAHAAAQWEEKELRARFEEQRHAALSHESLAIEYSVLDHEVQANQRLMNTVRDRVKEMTVLSEVQASSAFIIDAAIPPLAPSRPRRGLNLAGGIVIGLLAGLSLVFLVEVFDNRLRTPEEIENYLGLPTLGTVPDLAKIARRDSSALIAPGSQVSVRSARGRRLAATAGEAYRSIRTNLLLSQAGEPPRTILFTSATSGEGKTTNALNTALMYAQLDLDVLLIDADLRKGRSSRLLGIEKELGLSEALTGRNRLIRPFRSKRAPIDVIPSGVRPPNPTELLGSEAMRSMLSDLRQRYSCVVIDGPPMAPVSDSLVLSALVDGVVLVVDAQGSSRQVVAEARNRLTKARARLLGVVLNRIEPRMVDYTDGYAGPDPRRT